MTPVLEIALLGPLEVWRDGRSVPVTAPGQRLVLAVLALELGAAVSAERLAEALWPDQQPRDPRAALQVVVSKLRAAVGRDAILTDAGGYRLDPAIATTDLRAVEDALRDGADLAAWQRAAQAWRGEALAEFSGLLTLEPERVRLAALRAHVREGLLSARVGAGDAAAVLPELEAAVVGSPDDERPLLLLLDALDRSGRRSEALDRALAFRQRLRDRSGIEPSATFEAAHRRLLGGDDPTSAGRPDGSGAALGVPPGPDGPSVGRLHRPDVLVGRRRDLERLDDLVDAAPLTTVVGPGGVGKTSLVAVWCEGRPGVGIVELHHLRSGADVLASSADQLAVESQRGDALTVLVEQVAARYRVLVLDNCEHVLDGVRPLVEALRHRAASVRIVCTSRQRLGVHGEQVLSLRPLPVPDASIEPVTEDDGVVALFVDRARRADAMFEPDRDALRDVVEICRAVDGLPLAIELAAARVPAFGIRELRRRVAEDIRILEQGEGRHRSLASVLDWSIGLLDDAQRTLLRVIAAFDAPVRLEALEAVVAVDAALVPQRLARLVDAHLVIRVGRDLPRFRLHVPTRLHVLASLPQPDGLSRRMASWAVALTRREVARLGRPGEADAVATILGELPNLRAAARGALLGAEPAAAFELGELLGRVSYLSGSVDLSSVIERIARRAAGAGEPAAVGALAAAARTAAIRGAHDDALRWIDAARPLLPDPPPPSWYLARHARAIVHYYAGEFPQAIAEYDRIVDDARLHEPARLVAALERGSATARGGAVEAGRSMTDEALERLHEIGGEIVRAWGTYVLASIRLLDDPEAALAGFDRAIALADAAGTASLVQRLAGVGRFAALLHADRFDAAATEVRVLLDDLVDHGKMIHVWSIARLVAAASLRRGDVDTAALLVRASERDLAAPRAGSIVDATRDLDTLPERLGTGRWDEIGAEARALSRDEAIARLRAVVAGW